MDSYCWDTSVFLALLRGANDNRSDDELLGLRAAVDDVHNGRAILVTSTLIFAEVLPARMPDQQYDLFRSFLQRDNVVVYEVSAAIAHAAGDIRTRAREAGLKTATEDAIFVATALSAACSCLHSFDPHHLRLADLLASELSVSKPSGMQASMDLDAAPGTD